MDTRGLLPPARHGGQAVSAFLKDLEGFVARGRAAQAAVDQVIAESGDTPASAARDGRSQLGLPHMPPPAAPPPPRIQRPRRPARFKVKGQFDGAPSATITIADGLFIVRPFGRRRVYELRLADVARGVLYDVIKAELAARAKARSRKRGKARP